MVDFKTQLENMKGLGFTAEPQKVIIKIPDARENILRGMKYYTENPVWLPEYNEIAGWATDNNGRGLLVKGNCGLGKTLICGKILPVLINFYCHKVICIVNAQKLNTDLDNVLLRHIIYIDDIGTEGMSVKYGDKRLAFAELVDEAEKKGKLLMITTNLNDKELSEKYGERVLDRLHAITKSILFTGKSFRK